MLFHCISSSKFFAFPQSEHEFDDSSPLCADLIYSAILKDIRGFISEVSFHCISKPWEEKPYLEIFIDMLVILINNVPLCEWN